MCTFIWELVEADLKVSSFIFACETPDGKVVHPGSRRQHTQYDITWLCTNNVTVMEWSDENKPQLDHECHVMTSISQPPIMSNQRPIQ